VKFNQRRNWKNAYYRNRESRFETEIEMRLSLSRPGRYRDENFETKSRPRRDLSWSRRDRITSLYLYPFFRVQCHYYMIIFDFHKEKHIKKYRNIEKYRIKRFDERLRKRLFYRSFIAMQRFSYLFCKSIKIFLCSKSL